MSARYMATGSPVFSPALNAGVGAVGVKSRSTPEAMSTVPSAVAASAGLPSTRAWPTPSSKVAAA